MQKRAANGRSRGIVFGQSVFVVSAADAANGKRSNRRGYAVQSANVFNAENVIRIVLTDTDAVCTELPCSGGRVG